MLSYKEREDPSLFMLTRLTNLKQLAIGSAPAENMLSTLSGLTKLIIGQIRWGEPELTSLKQLADLTLCDAHLTASIERLSTPMTRLVIEEKKTSRTTSGIYAGHQLKLTNLKHLVVQNKAKEAFAHLELSSRLTTLEHANLAVMNAPSNLTFNTNLTHLELRCNSTWYGLCSLSTLTWLQTLHLNVKHLYGPAALQSSFTFLTNLPLRSVHLHIDDVDNTEAISCLNADLLLELGLDIDLNSKFKDHLTRLTNLESLTLTSSRLQSVTIASLTRLTRLQLHQVQCGPVAPLKVLSVHGNQRALAGLNKLTNLEQLNCALKPTELSYMSSLTRLQDLHLIVKGSLPASFTAPLAQLTRLKLDAYNFPALQWLTSLTRVVHLDLIHTTIKHDNFGVLTALSKLTLIKVNCSQPDLTALFKLTRLEQIQFAATFNQRPPDLRQQFIENLPHFIVEVNPSE